MIITTLSSYWNFCKTYNSLNRADQRLTLQGGALLQLRDEPHPKIREKLVVFLREECETHGVVDKTANFV